MAAITHCLLRSISRSILRPNLISRPPSSFFRFFTGDKRDRNLEIEIKHILEYVRDTMAEYEKYVNRKLMEVKSWRDTHLENLEASFTITEDQLYLWFKVPLHPLSMDSFIVKCRQDPKTSYEYIIKNIGISDAYAADWSKFMAKSDGIFEMRFSKRKMEANIEDMNSKAADFNKLRQHYFEQHMLAEEKNYLRAEERSYMGKECELRRLEDNNYVKMFVRLPLMNSIVVGLSKEDDNLTINGTDPHTNEDITLTFKSVGLSLLDTSKVSTFTLSEQRQVMVVILPKLKKVKQNDESSKKEDGE